MSAVGINNLRFFFYSVSSWLEQLFWEGRKEKRNSRKKSYVSSFASYRYHENELTKRLKRSEQWRRSIDRTPDSWLNRLFCLQLFSSDDSKCSAIRTRIPVKCQVGPIYVNQDVIARRWNDSELATRPRGPSFGPAWTCLFSGDVHTATTCVDRIDPSPGVALLAASGVKVQRGEFRPRHSCCRSDQQSLKSRTRPLNIFSRDSQNHVEFCVVTHVDEGIVNWAMKLSSFENILQTISLFKAVPPFTESDKP